MNKRWLVPVLLLALILSACSASRTSNSTSNDSYELSGEGSAPSAPQEAGFGSDYSNNQQPQRIVIKNANISVAVNSPPESMDRLSRMAEEMGGFVVRAQVYQSNLSSGAQVPEATLTIRVPAERLNDALASIRAESTQPVIREEVESEDVTREYTDLQSRLRNLEAAEAQLQEIMETATDTTNVLNVYNELVRVREQIELIKGQIQYYEQAAALSSISITLRADEAVQPLTIAGWQPAGVAKSAVQALINAFQFLVEAGIWIVVFVLPVLIMILLPVYLLVRLARWAFRRGRKPAAPPPADPKD